MKTKSLCVVVLLTTIFFFSCESKNGIKSTNKQDTNISNSNIDSSKQSTNESGNVSEKQNTKTIESSLEFPFEKARQTVLQSDGMKGGIVYGYYKDSETKVLMFIRNNRNEDWIQQFVLITTDKGTQKWFMGQHFELSASRFTFIN